MLRHVAAKTSKRIQKSSFFVGKRIHIRVIVCVCVCKGPSEHREQLRAGAAARSDIEMLHAEVKVKRVAEPHPPAEREPLARCVGDGVAEASAAEELGGREGLPVVQHNALASFTHRHEAALGHLPPAPTSLSPGHKRMVCGCLVPAGPCDRCSSSTALRREPGR